MMSVATQWMRARRGFAALGGAVLVLAGAQAAPAQATGADPEIFKERKTCGNLGLTFIGRIDPAKPGPYVFGPVTFTITERTRLTAKWSVSGGALSTIIVRGGPLNAVYDVTGQTSGSVRRPWRSPAEGKGKGHGWGLIHIVLCGGPKPPESGRLIVRKVTKPHPAQASFPFTVSGMPGQTAAGLPASFELSGGQSKELAGLPGGQYVIAEAPVQGWTLAKIECELDDEADDRDAWKPVKAHDSHWKPGWPGPVYDLGAGTASVTVPAGETVVCSFRNEQPPAPQPGRLIVKKLTDPPDSQASFAFTVGGTPTSGGAPQIPGLPSSFSLGHGQSKDFPSLPAGSYTISEGVPAGWRLAVVKCKLVYVSSDDRARSSQRRRRHRDGGATQATYDLAGGTAQVMVPAGKTVLCVFRNEQLPSPPPPGTGRIIVEKLTYPAGASESFAFTVGGMPGGPASFSLKDGELKQVADLAPGSYTVSESPAPGWSIASINCWAIDAPAGAPTYDLAAGRATVQVVPGGTVICAYLNAQAPPPPATGTIIISKLAPGATGQAFGFTTGVLAPAAPLTPLTFTLGHGQSRTYGPVPVGIYTVTEDAFIGWTLQQASCTDIGGSAGGASTSVTGATATINLAAGDIVWCVYTNAPAVPPAAPPAAPPPAGGTSPGTEQSTPTSRVRLSAPRRCVRGRYSIRVRGGQVSSISVSLNGRHVKTVSGRSGVTTYTVTIPVRSARVQRVAARVRFRPGVTPRQRTLRATMIRCRAAKTPFRLTG